MTDKIDVEQKFEKLLERVGRLKPIPAQAVNPAPQVLDAIRAGEPVVANKPFHAFGDVSYQPGDAVDVDRMGAGKVAQLAQHGYVLAGAQWNEGLAYQAAHDLLENQVTPVRSTLEAARRDAAQLAEKVTQKAAELAAAKQRAADAGAQVEYWQAQLTEIMAGDDVTRLLE